MPEGPPCRGRRPGDHDYHRPRPIVTGPNVGGTRDSEPAAAAHPLVCHRSRGRAVASPERWRHGATQGACRITGSAAVAGGTRASLRARCRPHRPRKTGQRKQTLSPHAAVPAGIRSESIREGTMTMPIDRRWRHSPTPTMGRRCPVLSTPWPPHQRDSLTSSRNNGQMGWSETGGTLLYDPISRGDIHHAE